MTAATEQRASGRPARVPAGGVWAALATAETRRVTLHPLALAAYVVVLASWLVPMGTGNAELRYPDLTASSWTVQYLALLIAAATFVAANGVVLRARVAGNSEFEETLSLPRRQRVAAACVAPAGPALVGLLLAGAQLAALSRAPGAAGSVQAGELLTVPAVVILAGTLGILVGSVVASVAAAFITLVVLAVVGLVGLVAVSWRERWLAFVVGENPFTTAPMPSVLVDRPQWWHLLWLLGLAALCAAVSLQLAARRPWGMAAVVVAVAVCLSAVAAIMQLRPMSAEARRQRDVAYARPWTMQVCEVRNDVTYCAFPEFRRRIDAWADVVESQRAAVPPTTRLPVRSVRQRLAMAPGEYGILSPLPLERWAREDAAAGTPGAIPVSTRWSRGGVDSFDETEVAGFSALVAARMVGAPWPAGDLTMCGGRGALTLWLAAGATPETRRSLDTVLRHVQGDGLNLPVLTSSTGVRLGPRELSLAQTMLDADQGALRRRVAQHWRELTDEQTSVARAAALVGVSPPDPSMQGETTVCRPST
jgi:hypothetical protein